ncbi:hypothetical protein MLD38_011422 [Melastoma candidum]|uniref:Uncharacterized protein n=1 Tax=Melastoma candidum TaxID=119954 RepID=A0ACB9R457_9MYRT|nr:hypothetical protein MLD38_011422 [Melastoma candidum]
MCLRSRRSDALMVSTLLAVLLLQICSVCDCRGLPSSWNGTEARAFSVEDPGVTAKKNVTLMFKYFGLGGGRGPTPAPSPASSYPSEDGARFEGSKRRVPSSPDPLHN